MVEWIYIILYILNNQNRDIKIILDLTSLFPQCSRYTYTYKPHRKYSTVPIMKWYKHIHTKHANAWIYSHQVAERENSHGLFHGTRIMIMNKRTELKYKKKKQIFAEHIVVMGKGGRICSIVPRTTYIQYTCWSNFSLSLSFFCRCCCPVVRVRDYDLIQTNGKTESIFFTPLPLRDYYIPLFWWNKSQFW